MLCAAFSAAVVLGAFAPAASADNCNVQSDATVAWSDTCVAESQLVTSTEADPFAGSGSSSESWVDQLPIEWLDPAWDPASIDTTPPDAAAPPEAAVSPDSVAATDAAPSDPAAPDAAASGPAALLAAPAATAPALGAALAAAPVDPLAALSLTVTSQTLSWNAVSGVSSYVFVRKVPGQAPVYSTVSGTSTTPAAVPGVTVNYSVRTNVSGSAWAPEVSIAYPAPPPPPPPPPATTVPVMSVSGQTVSWTAISGVSSYVFASKVPGQATQYSVVNGTSATPPAVPGQTVQYGVRTNVAGSAWASPEASISYPSPQPPPSPTGSFSMGVVAGSALSYELSFIRSLGAHTARLEFGIGTSAASMASTIDAYAKAGIRPLLLATFSGRTPSTAEAQNLGSWAAAYGPGGTFWAGKSYPANTAVTRIEFGNETSYSYQFSDNSSSGYAARAQAYALRAKDATTAIQAANPRVGLLAQGDNAQQGTAWVANMFKAVPDLGQRVAGWTIHPYGPNWAARIDSTLSSTAAAGAPSTLPVWVTEWGLSTDNGRCLSDNYGWNACMTASTLHSALSGMVARYGSRLGAFYLYQAHDQAAPGTATGRESYFGALTSTGAAKGGYTTEVKGDLAANP